MEITRSSLPTMSAKETRLGFFYLVFQICFLSSALNAVNGTLSHPLRTGILNFLYFSINCIACLTIFGRFMKKNILRTLHAPRQTLLYAAAGFGIYFLCSSLLNLLIQMLFPNYVNLNDDRIWSMTGSDPIFMVIATVALAPVAEEILHRGLVFGTLRAKNRFWAYVLSALLFSSIHVLGYVGSYPAGYLLLALLQYLPAGFIFAWSYRQSGSIFTPILVHMVNNTILILSSR